MLPRIRRTVCFHRERVSLGLNAYFRLTLVAIELRLFGFRHIARRARPARSADPALTPAALHYARRRARAVDAAARHHHLGMHCLQRSLALHLWLRDDGLSSDLRIGVLKDGQGLQAHAWVELDGYPINDQPAALTPFTPLYVERTEPPPGHRRQLIRLARNNTWS